MLKKGKTISEETKKCLEIAEPDANKGENHH
jgi:hypothetical protein